MSDIIEDPENEGEYLQQCECGNADYLSERTCAYCGEPYDRTEGPAGPIFVDKNFRPATLAIIEMAVQIIQGYERQGYKITLRQLYYQFVSKGLIPNKDSEYKKLGSTINDGRLAGLISFDAIEDRNREADMPHVQESLSEIIHNTRFHFSADMWVHQPRRVEVWVEKDALSSIVERACRRYRAPHLACKGYMSLSAMWDCAKRITEAHTDRGQPTLIIHLGDHDPSGIDMTRDNLDRLKLLTHDRGAVEVKRIALNRDQVDHYNPPPNPAKITDSRAEDYIRRHGRVSWELDALEPRVLEDLIAKTIEREIDPDPWAAAQELEAKNVETLKKLGAKWPEILAGL